jgi:hypothetical protein
VGKKEKLILRLKSRPKDFAFDEAEALLISLGFEKSNKGKTSGSRVMFYRGNKKLIIHKPHPRKELLAYQVNKLVQELSKEGLV